MIVQFLEAVAGPLRQLARRCSMTVAQERESRVRNCRQAQDPCLKQTDTRDGLSETATKALAVMPTGLP